MNSDERTRHSPFPVTHWTLVEAVQSGSPDAAARALAEICRDYWYPIYAFLRHSGQSAHDAEDLTQAFFERIVTEETLQDVRREQGRLRSFLIGVLRRLLSDHARQRATQKRGGGREHVSIDLMAAEERYAVELQDAQDPERIFAQAWARQLFESVREKLRAAVAAQGRAQTFDLLLPFLSLEDEPPSYREIAGTLGTSETAARLLIFRLRTKFRDLLREEVSRTVLSEQEIAGELAWLKSALSVK